MSTNIIQFVDQKWKLDLKSQNYGFNSLIYNHIPKKQTFKDRMIRTSTVIVDFYTGNYRSTRRFHILPKQGRSRNRDRIL